MNRERWQEIDRIFASALERPPGERAAFLDEACHCDEELRQEVESLLAHDQPQSFMEGSASQEAARLVKDATQPHPGGIVGHYKILKQLGVGGMGEVFLAQDTWLNRPIALKLLPAHLTEDLERMRRFRQEALAASALNHPNIITIHEIGVAATAGGSTHYIVTEYVEGETLRERLLNAPQHRLNLGEALEIGAQIAAAIEAAHAAGITHRDIKPENVVVRRDGIVKVLDFGLAKLTEPSEPKIESLVPRPAAVSTESGIVMGTPRYMSPEQARGEKVDGRTDLFSLGVLIYEMISGRAPFVGQTTSDLIAAILRDEAPALTSQLPDAPPALERIVSQALRKDREERYQTARELLDDVKHLQRDLEFVAEERRRSGQSNVAGKTPRSGRRNAIIGLVGIVIAATVGWSYFNRSPAATHEYTILLADFDNKTGDVIFDGTLKQGLTMQLEQSPFLNLFSEERVRRTLRLMGRPPEERVTAEIAREICVREGIDALIAGSIAPLGSHFVITLKAVNGLNGEALAREQVEAESKEQVLRKLSQATTRLREKLGESLSSIQQFDRLLEDATTSNLEAFKLHTQAVRLAVSGREMEAIPFEKRAVEFDPNFAYAWSILSITHFGTGRPDLAADYATRAYGLRDRVSEFEQLRLAHRYHYLVTGDVNKAIEALLLQKRMFPRVSTASGDLAVAYYWSGQTDQAIDEAHESFALYPSFFVPRLYLGLALLRINHFAESKEALERAIEQDIVHPSMHSALYQLAHINGDAEGMRRQIEWARGKPEEHLALNWQSGAAAFAGHWRRSQEFSRRAIDLTARGDTQEVAARYAAEQGLLGSVYGHCRQARADATQGLKLARGRVSLPRAALAFALCGEINQAKTLLDEVAKRFPNDTLFNELWLPVIRAAVELKRGNASQTIDHLQSTSRYEATAEFWPPYLRGQAYLKLGQNAEAAAEFQKILDHRGYAPLSPLYPLAQLGLARATQSRQAYDDFLTLWKDADAELELLLIARKEAQQE